MSNPTLTELITEGIKQAGESEPSTALLTRAEESWAEEIKSEIMNTLRDARFLHVTSYGIAQKGRSVYPYPSDFGHDLSITLLHGSETGTAEGGSTNTITLPAGTNYSQSQLQGKWIGITSGSAAGSIGQIVSYSASRVAAVVPDFAESPGDDSVYMIVNNEYPVLGGPIFQRDAKVNVALMGLPEKFYPLGDADDGEFIFDRAPDQTYLMRIRYYLDLTLVSATSTRMSTLYRRWRNAWVSGFKAKMLDQMRSVTANGEYAKWQRHIRQIVAFDQDGKNIRNLTERVSDYR